MTWASRASDSRGTGSLGPFAAQGIGAAGLPAGMPDTDRLGGDLELVSDLGLTDAGGEQLGGAQPASLQVVTLLLCRRAARDGWHAWILTRQATQLQLSPAPQSDAQVPFKAGILRPVPSPFTCATWGLTASTRFSSATSERSASWRLGLLLPWKPGEDLSTRAHGRTCRR